MANLGDLFPAFHSESKTMIFVDGENLAIRYGKELMIRGGNPVPDVVFEPDTFVWTKRFYNQIHQRARTIRTHYYTSVQGDALKLAKVIDDLRKLNIEHPSIFQKQSGSRSKQVDITLSTDMILHAARKNCETAVLVSGDQDYVPLVEAVKAEGCRVFLWFISNGLSPALERSVDRFFSIDEYLFAP